MSFAMFWLILTTFYVAMAGVALIVELVFQWLGLIPSHGGAIVAHTTITLSYTTGLNAIFLVIAALLVRRFLNRGGPHMIRMMDHPMAA